MTIKCTELSPAKNRYNVLMLSDGCITQRATFKRYRTLRKRALRSMGWTYVSGSVSI